MTLRLNGSNSGFTEVKAPATAGSNTLILPTSNGSADQYLKNGSTAGTLEFASLPANFNEVAAITLNAATHSVTGLPSTTYYIQIAISDFSLSADGNPMFRIGTSSGFATTGYQAAASYNPSATAGSGPGTQYQAGFGILPSSTNAGGGFTVFAEFALTSSNHWVYKHMGAYTNNLFMIMGAGQKDLGGTLDRIQFTSDDTTTLSGSMKVRYWSN